MLRLFTVYFFLLGVWGYVNLKFLQKCLPGYEFLDDILARTPAPIAPIDPSAIASKKSKDDDEDCCTILAWILACTLAIVTTVLNTFRYILGTFLEAGFQNPSAFKSFVLPVFFLLPLFTIYLGPLYGGAGYGDIAVDFFDAFVGFPDVAFAFTWPTELPVFGQACYAISLLISVTNILLGALARCMSTRSSPGGSSFQMSDLGSRSS